MSELEAAIERIDALEIRIAHQDRAIEDLNAAITDQWTAIDRLVRRVAALGEQIRDAESRAVSVALPQKPPHY